jgi:putative ABC transport system permease protein
MFKNQFTILFRQIWRNKLFTSLNVLGLSIGIAAAWIIFRMVVFEHSYDKHQPDRDRIYQVVNRSESERGSGSFAGVELPLYPVIMNDIPGLELTAPMYYKYNESVKIANEQGVFTSPAKPSEKQIATSPDFFKMLGYEWLAGDVASALDDPNKIVLTEKRANLYFPGAQPESLLGKVLTFNDSVNKQISGIVKELPYLNSFEAEEFVPVSKADMTSDEWGSFNSNNIMYVKLQKNVAPDLVLSHINKIQSEKNKEDFEKYKFKAWYEFYPLKDKHFATEFGSNTRTANKKVLTGLMWVGGFLLILGCINYINLSTAQIPQRAKEIGIRKTLGSRPMNIISSFMRETALITLMATILAVVLSIFAIKGLKDFLPTGIEGFVNYQSFVYFLVLLIITITLISGIYPAWLITRVNTVNILKGQLGKQAQPKRFNLRKGLIVFQFLVAQFFIICALIVGQQLRFTLTKDLGFNKEAIVTIDIPYEAYSKEAFKDKQFVLKDVLASNPDIKGVALGDKPLSSSMLGNLLQIYNDTGMVQSQLNIKYIDEQFLSLYDMPLVAGRNIKYSDSVREYIINEEAVAKFGLGTPENAIGKYVKNISGDKTYPIVGVVKDFHQFGFQSKIFPTGMYMHKRSLNTVNIKLPGEHPDKWPAIIASVNEEWKKLYPGFDMEYKFYDKTIEAIYQEEYKMSSMVKLATGISILISCLGLFGLATITAYQRAKEIGIRKVLGASISGIMSMLSKEFVILIALSIVLASPLAWWLMNKWLESFVFKIDIQWWIFILAGFIALAFALVTVSFQSYKAASSNPVDSLRDE